MEVRNILVIGSGVMGQGIAQFFVQNGINVNLMDQAPQRVELAITNVKKSWEKLVAKGKFTQENLKEFNSRLLAYNQNNETTYELIIEAIFENYEAKEKLFHDIQHLISDQTILATNTSGLSVTKLANGLPNELKNRFLGVHFFNPAPVMKLVEIIQTPWTQQNLILPLKSLLEGWGKQVAICKDTPGFIVNRINRNFYIEAMTILKSLDPKKIQKIDQTMEEVAGFRMGPFKLLDLIGIDTNLEVSKNVWKDLFYAHFLRPHPLQQQMVNSGHLGKKSSRGFYEY